MQSITRGAPFFNSLIENLSTRWPTSGTWITGKHGKDLTIRTIEYILENAKWRYHGLWYANKENEGNEDPSLPEMKR